MSLVKEKVSYLRGLCDGLDISDDAQRKMYAAIIDALDAIADTLDENEATLAELDECVFDIYDALDEFEEDLYSDDEDEDDEFHEEDFLEVTCPHCGEVIFFDPVMLATNDELICPACNKEVDPIDDGDIEE